MLFFLWTALFWWGEGIGYLKSEILWDALLPKLGMWTSNMAPRLHKSGRVNLANRGKLKFQIQDPPAPFSNGKVNFSCRASDPWYENSKVNLGFITIATTSWTPILRCLLETFSENSIEILLFTIRVCHRLDENANIGIRGFTAWKQKISSGMMLPPVGMEPQPLITCDSTSNTILSGLTWHLLVRLRLKAP